MKRNKNKLEKSFFFIYQAILIMTRYKITLNKNEFNLILRELQSISFTFSFFFIHLILVQIYGRIICISLREE